MGASSEFMPETKDVPSLLDLVRKTPRDEQAEGRHSLLATALEKMADEWRAGIGRPAETWLAELPELTANPEDAVRIVYEEYCLREESGEQVDSQQYYCRFPQWHDALAIVLKCHDLLRKNDQPQFPQAGEVLGELRLMSELGRGALGRVFLATQPSLSDRPLAVKITARHGQEHLSLARLQHTHIVPLYHVQDFPKENLRAMCMPFLGGAILERNSATIAKTSAGPTLRRADCRTTGGGPEIVPNAGGGDRAGDCISLAVFVCRCRVLDGGLPGRRAALRPSAWAGAFGHQAVERACFRRWAADVARFSHRLSARTHSK